MHAKNFIIWLIVVTFASTVLIIHNLAVIKAVPEYIASSEEPVTTNTCLGKECVFGLRFLWASGFFG